jgi:hypothetical protein
MAGHRRDRHPPREGNPVTIIMATLTFLTAPWALLVLWRHERWTMLPALVAWYVLGVLELRPLPPVATSALG